ncbi:energy transducer TonB [Ideonella sp.]|uniref:energy transducer TonB n=1 Tax=Ideonella sp. TaxID=1929293 RepID=UPI0035B2797B
MNYAEAQRNPTKHPVGLSVVIVLHVLLGYALVSGLARRVVEVAIKPVETKIIEEVKPPPPPEPEKLPPPPPKMPPPPVFAPPPEVNVAAPPVQAPTVAATTVAPPPTAPAPVVAAAPPAPPAPARVATPARIDFANCEKPEYPAAARRAEATGVTRVRFSIDETGHVVKAEVTGSSGSSREHRQLDKVAVEALSQCRFKPGMDENGKPVGAFSNVEYVWKLD